MSYSNIRIKLSLLIIVSLSWNIESQVPVFPDLTNEELFTELVANYKPKTVRNYSEARDIMFSEIYNVRDSVICVYTGHSILLPQGTDPSSFLYMDGSSDGINTEHVYPRSKGAEASSGNAFSDMHHLFPTRTLVNSSRSNFPFGEIEDTKTTSWFYLNNSQSNRPIKNIDLYSERKDGKFEPKEASKGNIARAMFYFFTMYRNEALQADQTFFEKQKEVLCNWHSRDPVDSLEWRRTYQIAAYQNDIPNAFVIDSTLANRIYCADFTTAIPKSKSNSPSAWPNPFDDWIKIKSDGSNKLKLFSTIGQELLEKEFTDFIDLDLSMLSIGNYYLVVNGQFLRILKV